ncbi:unnamed protein product [Ectocarpus sp. 13 AM-2016]
MQRNSVPRPSVCCYGLRGACPLTLGDRGRMTFRKKDPRRVQRGLKNSDKTETFARIHVQPAGSALSCG